MALTFLKIYQIDELQEWEISEWKLEERPIILDVTNIGILLTVTCTGFLNIINNIVELNTSTRLQWYIFYGKCDDFKDKIVKKIIAKVWKYLVEFLSFDDLGWRVEVTIIVGDLLINNCNTEYNLSNW